MLCKQKMNRQSRCVYDLFNSNPCAVLGHSQGDSLEVDYALKMEGLKSSISTGVQLKYLLGISHNRC